MRLWQPPGKTSCSELTPRARYGGGNGAMVGRVYEVLTRTPESRTQGTRGPWQVWEGGLVRVVVQGAGWPTNVLVEHVQPWAEFVEPHVVHTFCSAFHRKRWVGGIRYEGAFYPTFIHGGRIMVVTGERFVRPARGMKRVDKATPSR